MTFATDLSNHVGRIADYAKLIADELGLPEAQLWAVHGATHHERWDGAGYPRGLAGHAIPLPSRIMAVADVFDALITSRGRRHPWSLAEARRHLLDERGRHFDPACVDAFLARWDDVAAASRTRRTIAVKEPPAAAGWRGGTVPVEWQAA